MAVVVKLNIIWLLPPNEGEKFYAHMVVIIVSVISLISRTWETESKRRGRILHNQELRNLCSLTYIITAIKSGRMIGGTCRQIISRDNWVCRWLYVVYKAMRSFGVLLLLRVCIPQWRITVKIRREVFMKSLKRPEHRPTQTGSKSEGNIILKWTLKKEFPKG